MCGFSLLCGGFQHPGGDCPPGDGAGWVKTALDYFPSAAMAAVPVPPDAVNQKVPGLV